LRREIFAVICEEIARVQFTIEDRGINGIATCIGFIGRDRRSTRTRLSWGAADYVMKPLQTSGRSRPSFSWSNAAPEALPISANLKPTSQ
jgi:hypothetical protein